MTNSVTILGCRGSMSASGNEYAVFGGATTAFLVRLKDRPVIIDAGSGIIKLDKYLKEDEKELDLILSHPHADHVMGFPMCGCLLDSDYTFRIYASEKEGLGAEAQLSAFMKRPLWPVSPVQLPATVEFCELPEEMELGQIKVTKIEGNHPGGVTVVRLDCGKKSVVIASDVTLSPEMRNSLKQLAKDCSLLIIDGQYTPEEFTHFSDFGHSSFEDAAIFGLECGAEKTVIVHHAPQRSDKDLAAMEKRAKEINQNCSFGREEEVISL